MKKHSNSLLFYFKLILQIHSHKLKPHYSQNSRIDILKAHGPFSKIDNMLGHKTNFNKKNIIQIMFYDYNGMK